MCYDSPSRDYHYSRRWKAPKEGCLIEVDILSHGVFGEADLILGIYVHRSILFAKRKESRSDYLLSIELALFFNVINLINIRRIRWFITSPYRYPSKRAGIFNQSRAFRKQRSGP